MAGVPDGNYGHGPFVAEVLGATPPGGHVTSSAVASIVSRGGLTEFQGGGGNKPQYLYIPVPIKCQGGQPRGGGSNFSRGGGLSPPPPSVATGLVTRPGVGRGSSVVN